MSRPRADNPRNSFANVRLTVEERADMEITAARLGFASISEYVRHLHKLARDEAVDSEDLRHSLAEQYPLEGIRVFHQTEMGDVLSGDALCYLFNGTADKSVDLIMTSPPFGLVRKKTYGNEDAHRYCEWFRPFAEGFRRVLKDNGSLVIDIGGAWKPGTPTRSLYHFELLIMLCEEYGFHLCQEHYWWNPSKLPTPAEWVNVRRVRVKDAINCIWWLSPSPWPKASNRRILAPYSASMRHLLRNGYKAKLRPSGHDISNKFRKDNGGSVPPNLLAVANTESNGRYQEYCRKNDYPIHPARYPEELPEYFIRMLTNPGDLVVDPFAGSCVTGAVAEVLKRKWVCCELEEDYLHGAMARFEPAGRPPSRNNTASYSISPPCSLPIDETQVPLVENGGITRQEKLTKAVDAIQGEHDAASVPAE